VSIGAKVRLASAKNPSTRIPFQSIDSSTTEATPPSSTATRLGRRLLQPAG
jgi:hypothetical protein